MITLLHHAIMLLARVLISQIFIASAFGHLLNWSGTIEYMTSKGMAMEGMLGGFGTVVVHVLHAFAVAFLLLGGVSILLGFRARFGAVLLVVFLVPTTLIFHNFWFFEAGSENYKTEMVNFMKNTAILGGILMVLVYGSGKLSIDGLLPKRQIELKG